MVKNCFKYERFRYAVLSCLLLASCGDDTGVAPFEDLIPFPIGLTVYPKVGVAGENAAIPVADYVYVVGANFDMAYNDGVVKIVSLAKLDELMAQDAERKEPLLGRKFPPEVPTPFTDSLLPGAGVEIGSFGGEITFVTPRGEEDPLLLVAVRENNTVTPITVSDSGAKLSCFLGGGKECLREQSIETGRDDPYGLLTMTLPTIQNPAGERFVFVSHLRKSEVVFFSIDDFIAHKDKGRAETANAVVLSRTYGGGGMAFSPASGMVYLNSRTNDLGQFNVISLFDPLRVISIPQRTYVDEYVDVSYVIGGQEIRGLAAEPTGTILYGVSRLPNTVFALDVALRPDGSGPRNRIIGAQAVGAGPSNVLYLDLDEGYDDLLLVTCTDDDDIYVLDAKTLTIKQRLNDTGDAPLNMIAYRRPSLSGDGYTVYLMVGNFEESTLTVFEVDPAAGLLTLKARIGAVRNRANDFK